MSENQPELSQTLRFCHLKSFPVVQHEPHLMISFFFFFLINPSHSIRLWNCGGATATLDPEPPSLVQSTSLLFSCGLRSRYGTNNFPRPSIHPSERQNMLISEKPHRSRATAAFSRGHKSLSVLSSASSSSSSYCRLWTAKTTKMSE